MMLKFVMMMMLMMMICKLYKKGRTLPFQQQLALANVDEAPQQYFPT